MSLELGFSSEGGSQCSHVSDVPQLASRAAESSAHGAEVGNTYSKVEEGRGAEGAGWGSDMEKI